jgi:hypothetical protein
MFGPSIFFRQSAAYCGASGRAFVRAAEEWRIPSGVLHPTIRRVDWASLAGAAPGVFPPMRSDSAEDLERNRAELFAWAEAAWRGGLAPQLESMLLELRDDWDGRECHPFTFGYVRGAVEQIVDAAAMGDRPIIPGFVRVAAIVDVWGLEWLDEIDEAISELASGRLGERDLRAFHEGAELGMTDMERFLEGSEAAPRGLIAWFERCEAGSPRARRRDVELARAVESAIAGRSAGGAQTRGEATEGEPC